MRAAIARPRTRVWVPDAPILAAIAAVWALAIAAQATGERSWIHHHHLSGEVSAGSLVTFFGAWTAMVVAMMLPATLPFMRLFFRIAQPQPEVERARAALVGAYLALWIAFGAVAMVLDLGAREAANAWGWLGDRPWLIPGSSLLLAGGFQFTDLKEKCLTECRHPAAYLLRHYRRGVGAAFSIGFSHAKFCIGCCWAMMLLMFALGTSNLLWMAFLTLVMFGEKAVPAGDRIVKPVGGGLLGLGALVLLQPGWLPGALQYLPGGDHSYIWWCG